MSRRKGKLKAQLVAIFLLLSIIPAMIIMTMSITITRKSTEDLVSVYTRQIVEQLNYNINDYIGIGRGTLGDVLSSEYVKAAISRYYKLTPSEQSTLRGKMNEKVTSVINSQDMISGIYICSDGQVCYKNVKVTDTFDIEAFEASDVFIKMQDQNNLSGSWFCVQDGIINKIYLSRKMSPQDNGYAVVLMNETVLSKFLELANVEKCMSIMIVDENNEVVATTGSETDIDTSILRYFDALEEKSSVEIIDDNVVSLIRCTNGWKVISVAAATSLMMDFNRACMGIVLVLIVIVIIVAILSLRQAKRITHPIVTMASYMKEVQNGQLDVGMKIKQTIHVESEEIDLLVTGFSNMIGSLKEMIDTSKNVTATAKDHTTVLRHQAQATSQSAEDISSTIENISQGALKQRDAIEEAVKLVENLSENVNQVNNSVEEIRHTSQMTMNISHETHHALEQLSSQTENNLQISNKVSQSVKELGEETTNINQILNIIQSINKQTNLLAINASIEAVRAGDSGKGFMVVAEEVRKLSIEIAEAITRIAQVVKIIEEKRNVTLSELSEAVEVFNEQRPLVEGINQTFTHIYENMDEIDGQINHANGLITTVSKEKQEIENRMKDITQIAEEFACIIEEVNAETMEQVVASNKINELAGQLLEVVVSLENCY